METYESIDLMDYLQQAHDLAHAGQFGDAEIFYKRILDYDRDQHEARRHYARMLAHLGREEECIDLLEYTAAKESDSTSTLILLANALGQAGYKERAGHMYRRITALSPNCAWFQWCYAHWLLGEGRLKEGFELFEWGYAAQLRRKRHLMPEWDGTPIPGQRLYIIGEMGMGDVILYSRFVNAAKQRSKAQVIFEVHEPLVPLFTPGGAYYIQSGADEIVATEPNYSFRTPFDAWINSATLPKVMGIETWDQIRTDPINIKVPRNPIRVGLAWKGSPKNPIDRCRSVKIEDFSRILGVEGIEYVNLQYNTPAPDGVVCPDISTSDRLAAEIAKCDLVVSVDTFVANLSCAIGVPTHVLIGLQSDYRWTHGGDSTPWYTRAIVYRQKQLMDWTAPLSKIRRYLESIRPVIEGKDYSYTFTEINDEKQERQAIQIEEPNSPVKLPNNFNYTDDILTGEGQGFQPLEDRCSDSVTIDPNKRGPIQILRRDWKSREHIKSPLENALLKEPLNGNK